MLKMERHEQILTFRPNRDDIVIPTPMGLIYINRLSRDTRKVRISLPGGLKAYVGEKAAMQENSYLERKNGKITPRFTLLVPKIEDGEFVGLVVPGVLNLEHASGVGEEQ